MAPSQCIDIENTILGDSYIKIKGENLEKYLGDRRFRGAKPLICKVGLAKESKFAFLQNAL
jgi:hypothetical protein